MTTMSKLMCIQYVCHWSNRLYSQSLYQSENQCSGNLMAGVYLLCITRVAGELESCNSGFCKSAEHTYCPASEGTRSSIVSWLIPELGLVIINLPPFVMLLSLCLHVIETILCGGCKLVTVHVASTNLPATGLLVLKLTCTSARKVCRYTIVS